MKKNVINAILAGFLLIIICIGAYFMIEQNKKSKDALQDNIEGLKKVREITNKNDGFDSSTLPDDYLFETDTTLISQ